jgi:outer membrane protein assembly factor BamB
MPEASEFFSEAFSLSFPVRLVPVMIPLLTLLLTIEVTAAADVTPGDWPCWRGPHRDGRSRETGLLKTWPTQGPRLLWQVPLTGGYSSVAVAQGRLFAHTARNKKEEIVLCLDAATGNEIWRFTYPCDYDRCVTLKDSDDTGPRATPAVDGSRVYTIGTTGIMLCLETSTGMKVWERDLLKTAGRPCPLRGFCGSPLIVSDRIFVQTDGTKNNALVALDKRDGTIAWQTQSDQIGHATPIWFEYGGVAQILFFNPKGAVAVAAADGRLLWRYHWKMQPDNPCATPIFADGKVFLSAGHGVGSVVLRLASDGKPELTWKSRVMQNRYSSSVFYQGYLYGFSSRLQCVEFATGKLQWDRDGLGHGSLVVVDGHLLLLGEAGDLVLAEASPTSYVEKSRCKPLDGPCLTVPVVAGGRLYLRNERLLMALDLKAE